MSAKRADLRADAELFNIGEDICEDYTSWGNGEIYVFEILDFSGDVLDSCWGFVGHPNDSGIIVEARNALQSAVES